MEDLGGKVAVVTGAASGIGLALAQRFAAEGMKVVMADIEREALDAAAAALADTGADVLPVVTDVSDPESVHALADATIRRFDAAHVVCNNAGVATGGLTWQVSSPQWQWILGVNLMGVVHGIQAFVPRLVEQGEGHVVNTASAAGLLSGPGMSPYYATKHAVVALSESLHADLQLAGSAVGVSVLCPEWVKTRIAESDRNQPPDVATAVAAAAAAAPAFDPEGMRQIVGQLIASGLEPSDVAAQVLEAIRTNRFYVLTHPTTIEGVKRWVEGVEAGERRGSFLG